MRTLATIQTIQEVQPIENADAIERVKILGWYVVARKGELKVGDRIVYCEVDSLLPERPEFEFLRKSCFRQAIIEGDNTLLRAGFRIRTVKLRGQVSQGICFPLSILPEGAPTEVGSDVTDLLDIIKYDPPLPSCLSGVVKGHIPDFIPKTDETRVQVLENLLARHQGKQMYMTEKLDGSSATVFCYGDQEGVCGRTLWFHTDDPQNTICRVVREMGILPLLRAASVADGCWYAIQGEIIGPGIQKNRYGLNKPQLRVFNVLKINDGAAGTHLVSLDTCLAVTQSVGLQMVPWLGNLTLDHSVDQLVELSKGKSRLNDKVHREGLVIRPYNEENDPEIGRLSFKAINPDFLLRYEE